MPHPVSKVHPQMSMAERAAQFSPFAALTGYGDAVKETARLTDKKIELDEDAKEILDEKLRRIQEQIKERPKVEIIYFQPDGRKKGGSYITIEGCIKKIDDSKMIVVMQDETKISIEDITEINWKKNDDGY